MRHVVLCAGMLAGGLIAGPAGMATAAGTGAAWQVTPVSQPPGGLLSGVSMDSPADAWAFDSGGTSGSPLIHWDGTAWSRVQGGPAATFNAGAIDALSPSDVWVTGPPGSPGRPVAWHFDGTSWTRMALPLPPAHLPQRGYIDTMTSSAPGDVWAFGYRTVQTGPTSLAAYPLADHWNGTAWSAVTLARGTGWTTSAVQVYASAMVAGHPYVLGFSSTASGGTLFTERLADRRWAEADFPAAALNFWTAGGPDQLAIAGTSVSNVWVTGNWSGTTARLAHWNGHAWSAVPVPVKGTHGDFNAIEILSPGDIWLIGSRYPGRTLTDQWNGTSWVIVPSANAPSGASVIWAAGHDAAGDIMAVGENLRSTGAYTPFAMLHQAAPAQDQ